MFDRPRFCQVEDGEEIGMDRGLATAELDDVGRAFAGDDGIEHGFDLLQCPMPAMGGGGTGVTGGAGEIASFGDFDEGETAVLFVIGADAAVIGAAMDGGGMWFPGVFAGLVV